MGKLWQIHEAENRFDEIVEEATKNDPQNVTLHERPIVIIMSAAEYHKTNFCIKSSATGSIYLAYDTQY